MIDHFTNRRQRQASLCLNTSYDDLIYVWPPYVQVFFDCAAANESPLNTIVDSPVLKLVQRVDSGLHGGRGEEGDKVAGVDGDGDDDEDPPESDNDPATVCGRHDDSGWKIIEGYVANIIANREKVY